MKKTISLPIAIIIILICAGLTGWIIVTYYLDIPEGEEEITEMKPPGEEEEEEEEEGKGISPWYRSRCSEFSIKAKNLPEVNTDDWQVREHRYNYSFKYPSDAYEWNYNLGTCEDRKEINPGQECGKNGEVGDSDTAVQSYLTVSKKRYEFPEWWSEDRNEEICLYQSPYINISVYLNSAKLGLSDICQENGYFCRCATKANYEIAGLPAIRCTSKCTQVYEVQENQDWLSGESKEWIEQEGYKPGDLVECYSSIDDSIIFLHGDHRYVISSFSEKQDKNERAIFEGIISTFSILE